MSTRIDTTILCDIAGCENKFHLPNTKAYNLRYFAKDKGWHSIDCKDLCPECAKSPEKRKSVARKKAMATVERGQG